MDGTELVRVKSVFVVDDDANLRAALSQLVSLAGWNVQAFASPSDFEARIAASERGVLLLDVEFPDDTGLGLQSRMVARHDERPIIFMTGRDEVAIAVQAMRNGALDYLVKPFGEVALFETLSRATGVEAIRAKEREERSVLDASFDSLSPREKEVMSYVVAGKLNKQIADELSIAEITVKVHRSRVMQKMRASSLAALVRLNERLRRS
jgi:FixJ family two-component response regulator